MQKLGPEMGNYVVVTTAEMAENGFPKNPGQINGGFFDKTAEHKSPTIVIAVDDIYQSMKDVEAAGGKIIGGGFQAGQPDDIPGIGLYIAIQDTEGNRVAMLQPKGM
jgi:predicted enzyme related to lactoylglutathione lyase